MKREVFEGVGMFNEELVAGEDFDLHNRIVAA
jgi:GT2 family glycosyltransferase